MIRLLDSFDFGIDCLTTLTTRLDLIDTLLIYLDARDAISKALYSSLFTWLVSRLNKIISGKTSRKPVKSIISILDIFGFEDFQVRSILVKQKKNKFLRELCKKFRFFHENCSEEPICEY